MFGYETTGIRCYLHDSKDAKTFDSCQSTEVDGTRRGVYNYLDVKLKRVPSTRVFNESIESSVLLLSGSLPKASAFRLKLKGARHGIDYRGWKEQ